MSRQQAMDNLMENRERLIGVISETLGEDASVPTILSRAMELGMDRDDAVYGLNDLLNDRMLTLTPQGNII